MKLIAFATLAVAFIASVNSKFNVGKCPGADVVPVAFKDYTTAASVPHYFTAMDGGLLDFLQGVESFGFKSEIDYYCGQLGEYEPWATMAAAQKKDAPGLDGIDFYYDDEDIWNSLFNDRDDAVLKMIYFDDTDENELELYYFCADSLSLPAFFEFSGAFGLTPSTSLASSVNSIASIFTKVGLSFKLHGAFRNGWGDDSDALDITNELVDYDILIPGYRIQELVGLSKSDAACPGLELFPPIV